jgi:hypothetical protein
MAQFTVTNLTAEPIIIQEAYVTIPGNATVSFRRFLPRVEEMNRFFELRDAGAISWSVDLDPWELEFRGGGAISDIESLPTATVDTTLVLRPDGSGGVSWQSPINGTQEAKVWSFQTNETTQYAGGFYEFSGTDDDFSPSIAYGDAGTSKAAHFMIVTGGATVDQLTVRVSGTSITDEGVQTGSDSEDIVIPESTAANSFFETSKKWNGQVTVEAISGTPVACNYGWDKYHDVGNSDFQVSGLECLWESDSSDSSSDIALIHHKASGWTFNAAADPTPPAPIAVRSTDHSGNNGHSVGPGAWKRTNLSVAVAGSQSEGILFCVTSGNTGIGTLSFRHMTCEVTLAR